MGISLGLPINEDAIEKYHALMEDVWGQRLLSEHLWGATKAFLQSELAYRTELAYRKVTLMEEMKLPPPDYYALSGRYFNETGLRHLSAAVLLLEDFKESPLCSELADLDVTVYKDAFERAQSFFLSGVVESGVPVEDVGRVVSEYVKQTQIVMSEGYRGLITNVIGNIASLMVSRTTELRGTHKASPLPVWKLTILAILLGTNVGAIVACFKTKKCTALGALAGSIPGWVAILLILGC